MKLLAIIGSQREYGNSFLLAKEVLKFFKEIDYEIIQLAKKEIKFCNLCGKCRSMDCPLDDDFNNILEKMKDADGIIFSYPKYSFPIPTKLLCFLERLEIISHFRRQNVSDYSEEFKTRRKLPPPVKEKPCCLFAIADPGESVEDCLEIVANEVKSLGMKLVYHGSRPGAHAEGKYRGDVIKDEKGIEDCRKLVRKMIDSINKGGR